MSSCLVRLNAAPQHTLRYCQFRRARFVHPFYKLCIGFAVLFVDVISHRLLRIGVAKASGHSHALRNAGTHYAQQRTHYAQQRTQQHGSTHSSALRTQGRRRGTTFRRTEIATKLAACAVFNARPHLSRRAALGCHDHSRSSSESISFARCMRAVPMLLRKSALKGRIMTPRR